MSDAALYADDFEETPWWWHAAPPEEGEPPSHLPAEVDVLVVGAGYTGLSAARTLAARGRETLVLDAQALGSGASTMNAGFVGRVLKHGFSALVAGEGLEVAKTAYAEAGAAFDRVFQVVGETGIDCHLTRCGRFIGALSPRHLESMRREYEARAEHLGTQFHTVRGEDVRHEVASARFCGGLVIPDLGSIHPGLYHRGLLEAARTAGASVVGHAPVSNIRREGAGFAADTPAGRIAARDVFVATNGYTDTRLPWFRRRVVPFNGYIIATERLARETMKRLMPRGRTVHDWNNNLVFMRPAPDEDRILLGWLTGSGLPLPEITRRLHGKLVEHFPELERVRVSRTWTGFCAGTFDLWPHIGVHEGVHYALGWCFAGLPMGSWLGHRAALRILGEAAPSAFDTRPLQTRAWYTGRPWFVPWYMKWLDREDRHAL